MPQLLLKNLNLTYLNISIGMEYLQVVKRVERAHESDKIAGPFDCRESNCSIKPVLKLMVQGEEMIIFPYAHFVCCVPAAEYSDIICSPNLKYFKIVVDKIFGLDDGFIGVLDASDQVTVLRLDDTGFVVVCCIEYKRDNPYTAIVVLQNGLAMINKNATMLTYQNDEIVISPLSLNPYYHRQFAKTMYTYSYPNLSINYNITAVCNDQIVLTRYIFATDVSIVELEQNPDRDISKAKIRRDVAPVIEVGSQTWLRFSD